MSNIHIEGIEYGKLNKIQKLALFMVVVGSEAAAELMKEFEDSEIEALCREISKFQIVPRDLQVEVIADFSEIMGESLSALLGGNEFARNTLERIKGGYKAASLLGRVAPEENSANIMSEISDMEARQILNLVCEEQPQTIAFIVSNLRTEKAGEIVSLLPADIREEVIEKIGVMDSTSLENANCVVTALQKHLAKQKPTMHTSGGIRTVADLLNLMDKEVSKDILNKIETRNPQLGNTIRRKMFSFEDLVRLDVGDLQRVTREVEMSDLTVAMKSANASLQEAIFSSVSKRAAQTLKEEIDMLGPVRLKDVEAAQDKIIQIVRRLEEEGEITIDGGSDVVV